MLGIRKNKNNTDMDYEYIQALKNKKIPLLVLDPKWHELFPEYRKNSEIKALEKKLNDLIKLQGQTTNDIKEYEKAKKTIMENIVENMTDGHEETSIIKRKKQDMNKKLMNDLNDKIEEAHMLEEKLPNDIQIANKKLLIACMRVCYKELTDNTEKIEELESWVNYVREELKNKILEKQDMEMRNTQLYKYMHNLLGPDVVEIFDKDHNVWKGNVEENSAVK